MASNGEARYNEDILTVSRADLRLSSIRVKKIPTPRDNSVIAPNLHIASL